MPDFKERPLRRRAGGGGMAISTWKRWPLHYRVGVLFALALLLQGQTCGVLFAPDMSSSTYVPGIAGKVSPQRQVSSDGRHYYGIYDPTRGQRVVYEGSPEYAIIDQFFRGSANPAAAGDRAGVPGGAGSLPIPPVQ
jgi:hypothetical protein